MPMPSHFPSLGHTRSALRRDHLLHTPDTFVRIPLPAIERGTAIVHTSAAAGAGFTQYTAELEHSGTLAPCIDQRFLFLLEGSAQIVLTTVTEDAAEPREASHSMQPGSYAFLPSATRARLSALEPSRLVVIEKVYEPHPTLPPPLAVFGHEEAVTATPLMGDPDLEVRALLPDSPAYDFAVNVMTYQPGAALPMVEVHVMEHGLLMLAGGGIYRLGDQWYPVGEGDFIWMAPWCPQWFGALGKQPARYLIYKDFNRHPHISRAQPCDR
jgi:(S)-ureidoglycine aminohydrolase